MGACVVRSRLSVSQSCGAKIRGGEFARSPTAAREVSIRPVVPQYPRAHHSRTLRCPLLVLLCSEYHCIIPPFIFCTPSQTSHSPLCTSSRAAHPHPRKHSFTSRCASLFKLWPFRHCSGILKSTKCWKSSFPPTPIRLRNTIPLEPAGQYIFSIWCICIASAR